MANLKVENFKKDIKNSGILYYLLIFLGAFQSVLTAFFAISVKILINAVEYKQESDRISLGVILVFISVIGEFLCGVLYKLLSSKLVTQTETKIKKSLFSAFIKGDFASISQISSGDLLLKIDKDASSVASISTMLVPSFVTTVMHILSVIVALLILQPIFTLIILACAVIVIAFTFLARKAISSKYKKTRESEKEFNVFLTETQSNSLIVKSFSTEDRATKKSSELLDNLKGAKLSYRYLGSFISSISGFMFTAFYAITIAFGAYELLNQTLDFGFGTLIAMLSLVTQIKSPIASLSGYLSAHAEMKVSVQRLSTLLLDSEDEKVNYTNNFEKIEVENASFSYGDNEVINGVSFTALKGDKILIKGKSGIGKSTLLKVVCGLYRLNDGECKAYFDGNECDTNKVKGLFSIVPQGNMLFSGTIRENLTFATQNASEQELLNALKVARLDEFVNGLPNGLDTKVGVMGNELSEGQKQRLAVARALLSKRPIILLDEVTSALDDDTEKELVSSLSKIENLTLIVVSHKKEAQKVCNKVIEL